jgi:hypothetical protein
VVHADCSLLAQGRFSATSKLGSIGSECELLSLKGTCSTLGKLARTVGGPGFVAADAPPAVRFVTEGTVRGVPARKPAVREVYEGATHARASTVPERRAAGMFVDGSVKHLTYSKEERERRKAHRERYDELLHTVSDRDRQPPTVQSLIQRAGVDKQAAKTLRATHGLRGTHRRVATAAAGCP